MKLISRVWTGEAEVREGKVGVRYVKDDEEGWTPVVKGGGRRVLEVKVVIIVVIWTWMEGNW